MSTADAVLGGARLQMASYEMIGNAVQNGFAQLSQAQKARGDAYEGMFRSALGFRQQQQDAYFRQKNLELDEKRLTMDGEYKNSLLSIQEQELEMKRDDVLIRRQEREDGLKNKTSISALHGIRVSTGAEGSALDKQIDFNNKFIETGTKQLELYKTTSPSDYFGPKGIELKARIEKAQSDNSMLGTKRIDIGGRFEEITGAIQAIGAGADPQSIIGSLNLSKVNKNTIDDPLIETRGFGNQSGNRFGVSFEQTGNPLFGDAVIPPDPISPDQLVVKLGTNDVLQVLMNEKSNEYAKKQAVALADEPTKKYISESRNAAKYEAAVSFASSIGWNLPKELINRNPNAVKQIEAATKTFKDLQGNESEIGKLIIDSQRALSDIRNDPSVKDSEGNIIVAKVQDKFDTWVRNEINPQPAEETKTAFSPTGELKASNGASLNFGIDLMLVEKRGFINDEAIIPDLYETNKDKKREIDVTQDFNNRFIKNGQFDKKSFTNWAATLSLEQLGLPGHLAPKKPEERSWIDYIGFPSSSPGFEAELKKEGLTSAEYFNKKRKEKILESSDSKESALNLFKQYGR